MIKNSTLLLLSLLFLSTAHAQHLITEDFNYSAGQLTDSAGGANVSNGVWKPNTGANKFLQVATGNLSYTDYITSPDVNSGRLLTDSTTISAEDAYTGFTVQNSNTVYASFLLNLETVTNLFPHDSAIGEYFIAFLPSSSTTTYTCRLYIRKGIEGNTFNLGICAGAANATTPVGWSSSELPTGVTHLVTIAYEFIAGTTNNVAKLWVNPAYTITEPAPDASSVTTGSEPADVARFAVRQAGSSKGGTPKAAIDAIKVTTSWADGTLPLQLKSVSVINSNGFASLKWETCNEINVKKFEIQRSTDAANFTTVGEVAAKNAGCATQYTYTDAKGILGTAYYRIRSVDNNGVSVNSAIVSVTGKIAEKISILQNPVTSNLVLAHPLAGSNASIQVVSISGKYAAQQKVQTNAVQTTINVSSLSKGTYIVVFTNNGSKQTLQFVKQ